MPLPPADAESGRTAPPSRRDRARDQATDEPLSRRAARRREAESELPADDVAPATPDPGLHGDSGTPTGGMPLRPWWAASRGPATDGFPAPTPLVPPATPPVAAERAEPAADVPAAFLRQEPAGASRRAGTVAAARGPPHRAAGQPVAGPGTPRAAVDRRRRAAGPGPAHLGRHRFVDALGPHVRAGAARGRAARRRRVPRRGRAPGRPCSRRRSADRPAGGDIARGMDGSTESVARACGGGPSGLRRAGPARSRAARSGAPGCRGRSRRAVATGLGRRGDSRVRPRGRRR